MGIWHSYLFNYLTNMVEYKQIIILHNKFENDLPQHKTNLLKSMARFCIVVKSLKLSQVIVSWQKTRRKWKGYCKSVRAQKWTLLFRQKWNGVQSFELIQTAMKYLFEFSFRHTNMQSIKNYDMNTHKQVMLIPVHSNL